MEAPDDGIMGHMNTELFPKLTQPQTQGSLCNDLEAFCKVHGLPFMSADELMLSEGVDKDQRDWLSDFVEAWEAVMGQANEGKVELRTPVGVATKRRPSMEPGSFWSDDEFERCAAIIDRDLQRAFEHAKAGGVVVVPRSGIGTGRSELPTRAPRLMEHIRARLREMMKIATA